MPIDRQLLHDAETALRKGEPLDDESREYVARILGMVNQLAFSGYDVERICALRQKEASTQIRSVMNDMTLLGIAAKRGKGLEEAEAVVQSKRDEKHKIPALVNYVMAVEGIKQTPAQRIVAEAIRMDFENVKSIYARWKKHRR